MTLKDVIEGAKCRKGAAAGTTKRGAFWLACQPITIRRAGVGNNAPDVSFTLCLRHFRSGETRAIVERKDGVRSDWQAVAIIDCEDAESVIVALKGQPFQARGIGDECLYGDRCRDELVEALAALGLPECAPSPDDAADVAEPTG